MYLTRTAMWKWLEKTGPPRSIIIDLPSSYSPLFYEVGCQVGSVKGCGCNSCNPQTRRCGIMHGVTLAQSRTHQKAHTLSDKYQRWLDLFEVAKAEKGE